MKFLVTNDDGIDAPGIEALVSAARTVGEPVVVAPAGPQSGVSHAVTWHEGVRIEPRERKSVRHPRHAGRLHPARVCLHVVPEAKWILSGINHGANLGADVYYSGTVAAVREALLHGWPGIAFSHYRKGGVEFDWSRAPRWITPVLADLLAKPIEAGDFLQRQPAPPSAGRARPGSRLVSARSQTTSAQLPARGGKRALFRGRLQPAPSHARGRCRCLLRRAHCPDGGATALIVEITVFLNWPSPDDAQCSLGNQTRAAVGSLGFSRRPIKPPGAMSGAPPARLEARYKTCERTVR